MRFMRCNSRDEHRHGYPGVESLLIACVGTPSAAHTGIDPGVCAGIGQALNIGRKIVRRRTAESAPAVTRRAGREAQCFSFGGFLLNDSPSSSSRRMASDREGESFSAAHRSTARTRLSGIRTP